MYSHTSFSSFLFSYAVVIVQNCFLAFVQHLKRATALVLNNAYFEKNNKYDCCCSKFAACSSFVLMQLNLTLPQSHIIFILLIQQQLYQLCSRPQGTAFI